MYQKSTARGRRYITDEGRAYKDSIIAWCLHQKNKKLFSDFFKNIPDGYGIKFEVTCYYKNNKTKKGKLNSKCPDADNPVKIIQDSIFFSFKMNDVEVIKSSGMRATAIDRDYFVVNLEYMKII